METKHEAIVKQPNRIYLTPEQLKKNIYQSKRRWYENNKAYFQPGGQGYESISKKATCEFCGAIRWASNLKKHMNSKRCKQVT